MLPFLELSCFLLRIIATHQEYQLQWKKAENCFCDLQQLTRVGDASWSHAGQSSLPCHSLTQVPASPPSAAPFPHRAVKQKSLDLLTHWSHYTPSVAQGQGGPRQFLVALSTMTQLSHWVRGSLLTGHMSPLPLKTAFKCFTPLRHPSPRQRLGTSTLPCWAVACFPQKFEQKTFS